VKTIILWPEYFDCSLSRRLGRRVPKDLCVIRPSLSEIVEACRYIGIECTPDDTKRYPRTWYTSQGLVAATVEVEVKKTALMRMIAEALKKVREGRQ